MDKNTLQYHNKTLNIQYLIEQFFVITDTKFFLKFDSVNEAKGFVKFSYI